jgi:hypothetical protein
MAHKVYGAIAKGIRSGRLKEPFSKKDFEKAVGLGHGTYNVFLDKHSVDNPGGNTELLSESPGMFRCVRPFKYGL